MTHDHDHDYDLIVIGGGSGGLAAAKEAARAGVRVACFDYVDPSPQGTKWGLGGTCVNVGCIPKKLFHTAAQAVDDADTAFRLGWDDRARAIGGHGHPLHSWARMCENVTNYIKSLNFSYKNALRSAGVEYINGKAAFVDAHTVEFTRRFRDEPERATARYFVLAPGGRPRVPDGVRGAVELGITSDDFFWRKTPPGRTLVVGASYIALECAGVLNALGYAVTVLVRSVPLRGFDRQCAEQVCEAMERAGVRFERDLSLVALDAGENGRRVATMQFATGDIRRQEYDTVLFATGRAPATAALDLRAAGVLVDESGFVKVNAEERTSAAHVFAIGDAAKCAGVERPELTPVAIQAGQKLARRLFVDGAGGELMEYDLVPTTVFTSPLEYGCVGLSQEEAERRFGAEQIECYVSRFNAMEKAVGDDDRRSENARRSYLFDPSGGDEERDGRLAHNNLLAKLVVHTGMGGLVLGVHYVGPHAGEVVQGFALALRLGATKRDFDELVGVHPTLAEEFTVLATTLRSGDDYVKKEGCGGGGSCG